MKNKKGMIAQLVGVFVAILIGVSLLPMITKQVKEATASANMTGTQAQWANTVTSLVPAFFALAIGGTAIAVAASALSNAGLIVKRKDKTKEEEIVDALKDGSEDYEKEKEPIRYGKTDEVKIEKMEKAIDKIPDGKNMTRQSLINNGNV